MEFVFVTKNVSYLNCDYKIDLYSHYENFFTEDKLNKLISEVYKLESYGSFRYDFEAGSLLFSVLVNLSEKKLIIFSYCLFKELNLISIFENENKLSEIKELKTMVDSFIKLNPKESPTEIIKRTFQYNLPKIWDQEFLKVEELSKDYEESLKNHALGYKPSLLEKVSDKGLDLIASYSLFRIHILKFLAILPSLDHDSEGSLVKKIFLESLRRLLLDSKEDKAPLSHVLYFSIKFLYVFSLFIPHKILAFLIRKNVAFMAKRFIAGDSIKNSINLLVDLGKTKRDATLDQLGELVVSKEEADHYLTRVLEIIEGLKEAYNKGEKNKAGILRAHISIKVSALAHDFRPHAFDYTYSQIAPRLREILIKASNEEVFINIDAEHYQYRDCVFEIYKKVLLETPELKLYDQTGIVVQAYLKDAFPHLLAISELALKRNLVMPIRLVKGAYWDAETIEATAHNHLSFQFLNKEETDIHYRQLVYEILSRDELKLALASHNITDHAYAMALNEVKFNNKKEIEHQCLHMTYEALSFGLSKMGVAVRNYVPIGNLLVGMAYLVRRIMENSSQVGFLTIMRSHKSKLKLMEPFNIHEDKIKKGLIKKEGSLEALTSEFKNIFPMRPYMKSHLEDFKSFKPDLFQVSDSTEDDVKKALDQSVNSFEKSLFKNNPAFRFEKLLKVGDLMLLYRDELSALIVAEAKKTLTEAYADVDEAIDFIHFYVKNAIDLYKDYSPKGVVAVIAPWNFPLAILTGMTVAPLSLGNSVIVKPSEKTPLIGKKFFDLCYEAGIPHDILYPVYGDGRVGKLITSDPRLAGVVFTGSKKVGMEIFSHLYNKEIKINDSYIPKTCITEMGGKNAIIVTNNAELDETITGILYGAFGHAGQKCSACSRILVHSSILNVLRERLIKAASDMMIGEADSFSTFVNPIINQTEADRIRKMGKEAIDEATLHGGRVLLDRSYEYKNDIVGPIIIEIPKELAVKENSYAQTEIFGPVIHLIPYNSLDEAIEVFNSTPYALTGGIYAQSQDDIDYLLPRLEAGNIYVNRPNTGARVGIEPFGGFKYSGTGPKAGGFGYIEMFGYSNIRHEIPKQNRKIPGQLSFNDFSMPLGKGVLVVDSSSLDEKVITDLKLMLTLGNKLVIYMLEKNNRENIYKTLKENGISLPEISTLTQKLDFIYIHSNSQSYENILNLFNPQNIFKIFSSKTPYALQDFSHIRSFAINTMRHGAPLEFIEEN